MRSRSALALVFALLTAASLAGAAPRDLFVSSRNTNNVKRFDGETGDFLGNFLTNGAGGLDRTQDLAWGPDGHLYVTGIGNTAILKYDGATGAPLGAFTSGYALASPTKFTLRDDGFTYVSQWGGSQRIARFHTADGTFDREWTSAGIPNACQQYWDVDGTLYVAYFADGAAGGVRRFDPAGNDLGDFDQGGVLQGPVNVWRDGADFLVLDWTTGKAERLDQDGNHVGTFVSGLTRVEGWTYGPDGRLYLCDWGANVVNRYESDGTFESTFASGHNLNAPNACLFGLENPLPAPEPASAEAAPRMGVAPNPFRAEAGIRFALERSAAVTLRVLDVAGREVARLADGTFPAGEHVARWTPAGAAAGVYWVRLETEGGAEARRVTRLR